MPQQVIKQKRSVTPAAHHQPATCLQISDHLPNPTCVVLSQCMVVLLLKAHHVSC